MGSSFAQALKVARPDVVVVGSDPNPVVVRKALDREVVASANTDLSVVEMAEGGFRDMSRLAASDPDLYAGVTRTNRENLIEVLDAISKELARLRRHLEADDPRLVELFEEARDVRERWAKGS